MSLMSMNRAIRKNGPLWGVVLGVFMVGGIAFTGFGQAVQTAGPAAVAPGQNENVVATVGDLKLTERQLDARVEEMLRQQAMFGQAMPIPSAVERVRLRYLALNGFKQEQALAAAAKKAGITVSDADVARERDKVWEQARAGFAQTLNLKPTATDADIDRALGQQAPGLTVERLKEQRIPADRVTLQIYQEGLTNYYKKQVKASDADVRRSFNDIQVRHILVASGDNGLPEGQAKAKAEKILAAVKANPAKLAELAKTESSDPGSKDKGGLYDWAPASQYVPEFTMAALAAGVGKVYPDIVKTSYGYHIIKLEGERPGKNFPKDFDKEKQKYIDEYVGRIAGQKMQAAIKEGVDAVAVSVTDPLLKAAQFTTEADKPGASKVAQDTQRAQALAELDKVKKEADPNGVVPQMKAELYQKLGRDQDAITAYQDALNFGNTVEKRLAMAQLYLKVKDSKNALAQLDEAEKLAVPDVQTQMNLSSLLNQAGAKDRGKKAMDKAMDMLKVQMAQQQPQTPAIPEPKPATKPAPAGTAKTSAAASPSPAASPAASPSPAAAAR